MRTLALLLILLVALSHAAPSLLLRFTHGCIGGPGVDVQASDGVFVWKNVTYGETTAYVDVPVPATLTYYVTGTNEIYSSSSVSGIVFGNTSTSAESYVYGSWRAPTLVYGSYLTNPLVEEKALVRGTCLGEYNASITYSIIGFTSNRRIISFSAASGRSNIYTLVTPGTYFINVTASDGGILALVNATFSAGNAYTLSSIGTTPNNYKLDVLQDKVPAPSAPTNPGVEGLGNKYVIAIGIGAGIGGILLGALIGYRACKRKDYEHIGH